MSNRRGSRASSSTPPTVSKRGYTGFRGLPRSDSEHRVASGLRPGILGPELSRRGIVVNIRLLVAVVLLVSSVVSGCNFQSRNPPSTKTLQVPMTDVLTQDVVTQNITLAVGNRLIVKLGSNYSTPYRWTPDMKIGDPAIIKQNSHEFVPPSSDALGAPGTEMWTFTALKPGTTTMTTSYTSFVAKNSKPGCTYTAHVTVQ